MSTSPPPAPQPEHFAPQQYPPPGSPAGQSQTNGLGIASIVLGGLGLLLAILPLIGAFGGFLAFVGLVLGVVGLFLKNKTKITAIIGTATSAVALLLAIVMGIVYTAAFVHGVEGATNNEGVVTVPDDDAAAIAEEAPVEPAAELGSRENPAPIGSTITLVEYGKPVWDVSAQAPNWNVTGEVKAANSFNDDPAPGNQYASLPVSATYLGAEIGTPEWDMTFKYVTAEGVVYEGAWIVMDGQLSDVAELYPGATGSGTVIIEVPEAAAGAGTWSVESTWGETLHFAAQ